MSNEQWRQRDISDQSLYRTIEGLQVFDFEDCQCGDLWLWQRTMLLTSLVNDEEYRLG